MNYQRVFRILGLVLYVLAVAELFPVLWCFGPSGADWLSATGLISGAAMSAIIGLIFRAFGRDEGELYRREGVLIVVGSWFMASLVGAIPYLVSGAIVSPMDAIFETASGFTTTGASILVDIEAVSRPILMWRSFTQWLGGIGIIVIFVALLSELGSGARFLYQLEVPGPKSAILTTRVRETALALFRIYILLSAVQVMLMLLLGVSFYDALAHTFATLSTGGFSPYADSVGHFSSAVQFVVLVFMLAAGVNFSLYFALATSRSLAVLQDAEFRFYLSVAAVASLIVSVDVFMGEFTDSRLEATLDGTFQVVSLLTSTGFATMDFGAWSGAAQTILMVLMFAGGCAGSTAGGAKMMRVMLGWKIAMREVRLTYSPNSVIAVTLGGRVVAEESLRSVIALLFLWVMAWGFGAVALSFGDTDILTAATASLATLSNIGPGLGDVGPTENFSFYADWQKLVMVILMWLGRLEFFSLLALIMPQFWRR
ncbi:MAG: TrkH family potassium uptake protein [Myxococcota bacterium]